MAIDRQPNLGIINRVYILTILSDLNLMDGKTEESDQIVMEAIRLFPNLTELSVTDLQQFQYDIHKIVSFYQANGRYREARILETKQIESFKNFQKNMNRDQFIKLWTFAQNLYQEGNYSKALEVISVALNGYRHLSGRDAGGTQSIYIQMFIFAGKIELWNIGNFSSSAHYFTSVINYIQEHNITHLYGTELTVACIGLVINRKFHPCIGDLLIAASKILLYLIYSDFPIIFLEVPLPVENSGEIVIEGLSTAVSIPESYITIIITNHFGLDYFNEFLLLLKTKIISCIHFLHNTLLFFFSFAFLRLAFKCSFVSAKFVTCVYCTCRCSYCFYRSICQWKALALVVLAICLVNVIIIYIF